MKKILAGLLYLYIQLPANAQLSVGAEGIWVAGGTSMVIDSLSLEPVTAFTVTNNRLQVSAVPVPGNPQASISRVYQWLNPVSPTGRLGISYRTPELNGNNTAALQLAWSIQTDHTGFVTTTGSTAIANNVSNNFSAINWRQLTAVNVNAVLPVDLLSFTASRSNNTDRVVVRWVTVAEDGVSGYAVQVAEGVEALNNGSFISLGNVDARNEPGELTYSFNDDTPGKTGIRYYRLLIREADGTFRYSVIRPVAFDEHPWQAYPNPFNEQFVIKGKTTPGQKLTWKLYDATGKLVMEGTSLATGAIQLIPVNPGQIAAGVYFMEMTNGVSKQNFRLIKR